MPTAVQLKVRSTRVVDQKLFDVRSVDPDDRPDRCGFRFRRPVSIRSMMRALIVSACLLAVPDVSQSTDTVVRFDDTALKGTVLRLKDGQLEIQPDGDEKAVGIPLGNLSSVKLVPNPPDPQKQGSMLLIDNDGNHPPTEESGKIKLRKGLHSFTLLYFQGTHGATLGMQWEGPGIKKQKIPPNVLSKWKGTATDVTYSAGPDEEGFRLPDTIDETLAQIGYKLYEWEQAGAVTEVGDLRNITLKKYGTAREIGIDFPHQANQFGAVIYWLLNVPRDGEYTFYVNSDDGAQLYVGKVPPIAQPSVRKPTADEWLYLLSENAQLNLPLGGWDAQGARCTMKSGGQEQEIVIPAEHLRELWRRDYADNPSTVDRSGESGDVDTVYATNVDGQIQSVSGDVIGIEGSALQINYQGTERTIALERLAGVVMRQPARAAAPTIRRVKLLFDLCGPDVLVGHLASLTPGRIVIELPWGQELTLSRNLVYRMTILNGRLQSLQDLPPTEVVETPFLDHILHWQKGQSLTGGALQIGEQVYARGLSLHSRTRLMWDLSDEFERFQCDVGLQRPEGDSGNATVRISADGAELFVVEELTAAGGPQSVDVDLSGREQLTLEVDFGHNMHIGDHVVFGNARLLRPDVAP